jgi:Tubulin/FtsZ family, GTPase domain
MKQTTAQVRWIMIILVLLVQQQTISDAFVVDRPRVTTSVSQLSSAVVFHDDSIHTSNRKNLVWSPLQSWNHVGCHYNDIRQQRQSPKMSLERLARHIPNHKSNKENKMQADPVSHCSLSPPSHTPQTPITSQTTSTRLTSSSISMQHQQASSVSTAVSSSSSSSSSSSMLPVQRPIRSTQQRPTFLATNYLPSNRHHPQRHSSSTTITGSSSISSSSTIASVTTSPSSTRTQQYATGSSSTSTSYDGGLSPCSIKVIGVGGGGCNAIDRMLDTTIGNRGNGNGFNSLQQQQQQSINAIDYWALNTDSQVIGRSRARGANTIQIGTSVTRGLGAGGNPDVGRMAAEESRQDIRNMIDECDLCFITAGMGGGTGSGAAPVVAKVAKEMGCLTIAIVTKPFAFEGKRRMKQALDAMEELRKHVDTIIVVSNDRLLEIIPDDTPLERAFCVSDDLLRQGVIVRFSALFGLFIVIVRSNSFGSTIVFHLLIQNLFLCFLHNFPKYRYSNLCISPQYIYFFRVYPISLYNRA